MSLRIFLIHDDDSIHRIPVSRFLRLYEGDRKECLPAYAGKRIRYALTAVDLADRKPVSLLHTEYGFLKFDSEGFGDVEDRQEKDSTGVEMIDLALNTSSLQRLCMPNTVLPEKDILTSIGGHRPKILSPKSC